MKNLTFAILTFLIAVNCALAQDTADQRTQTTRIADMLATLPAKDAEQLRSAMNEISAIGKTGLVNMISMLLPSGKADNSKLQYAINGFSAFATGAGKENDRNMSVEAYCEAMQQLNDAENKAFIITQLELVGRDDAVACLQKYLTDKKLVDPAAQALVKINTPSAKKALLEALQQAQGPLRLSLIEALGNSRFKEAAAVINPLAATGDKSLTKVALHALATIADQSSETILANAAQKAGYRYENTNAVASYLLYAQNLAADGDVARAQQIAETLIKNTRPDELVNTRTAALKLLADIGKENSMPILLKAMKEEQPEYRAAALKFAAPYLTPATSGAWIKKVKRSDPAVKADVIAMMGDKNVKEALPAILKATRSRDAEVKLAAIEAAGKIGQEQALDALFKVMKRGDTTEIFAVKNALLVMKGNSVTGKVANAIPDMRAGGKTALIEVLAARAAHNELSSVYPHLKSEEPQVRQAAYAELKNMVAKEDLPKLFTLMNETSQKEEVAEVQQAIVSAVDDIEQKSEQSATIMKQMASGPANKQVAYYDVLAEIADQKSLEVVSGAFEKGDEQTKAAAIVALSKWADMNAAKQLYKISRESTNPTYQNQAVNGYIRIINSSDYVPTQKLLMLRNAMEVAKTTQQKQMILKEAGGIKTFPAMVFAGKYMDNTSLQQQAAFQVMNIALSDQSFYGNTVREMLTKSMGLIKGPDSEYQKESIRKHLAEMAPGAGFVSLFNGNDLTGWKGLVGNPIERAKMDSKTLAEKQKVADELMRKGWKVVNGNLEFTGEGDNLCTIKQYGDFEMLVDWKIYDDGKQNGDAGIYLRGTPQVQIWDTARGADGAQVGSGGLYNNQIHPSKPLKVADNALGEWNNFHIKMVGDRVTVHLNGELVTDSVVLENYWDRKLPIFLIEQLELQAHGSRVAYRDIYVNEIDRAAPFVLSEAEKKEGFKILFDGKNLDNWTGNKTDYVAENGKLIIRPQPGKASNGNLYTKEQYADFVFRFEFQLTPGANNGLGIRTPLTGDAAYVGMELQVLDNDADMYKSLKDYQFHGSVYGVLPAKRGYLKPTGEWNYQEVTVKGPKIKVVLNGTVILDDDISEARKKGTLDGEDHPGLKRDTGHIGFLGHGSVVQFKNIRIKNMGAKK